MYCLVLYTATGEDVSETEERRGDKNRMGKEERGERGLGLTRLPVLYGTVVQTPFGITMCFYTCSLATDEEAIRRHTRELYELEIRNWAALAVRECARYFMPTAKVNSWGFLSY